MPRYNRCVPVIRRTLSARLAAILAVAASGLFFPRAFGAQQDRAQAIKPGNAPHSTVAEIVLPAKLATDKPATLAVLDSDGRVAPGITVELSSGRKVVTNSAGQARFVADSAPGILNAKVPGTPLRASATVIASTGDSPSAVAIARCPRVITQNEHFPVTGFNFRGDVDLNRATINGEAAIVLAASPFALEISPGPDIALGAANLQIKVNGVAPAPVPLDVVALRVERRGASLTPGRKDDLVIRVDGSARQLALAVWNISSSVIALGGGNFQKVTSRGGDQNEAVLKVQGLREGAVSVRVRLVPTSAGNADLNQTRAHLQSAYQLASGDWGPRVAAAIERLSRDPQDTQAVRIDIEKMLGESPPAGMGRFLENAWIDLQR
jgi:hypothetical protein